MLDDTEIKAILNHEIDEAIGYLGSELDDERATAMDYYLGEATGKLAPPDGEDRSKVVDSTVRDVVEWVLPQLLKTFTQSSDYIRFDPVGPDDEEAAEDESDYVNHVIQKDNEGFLVFYSMFKDALLQKTGVTKVYWEDKADITREEYSGLTEWDLGMLEQDQELEVEAQESYEAILPDPQTGEMVPTQLFNVVYRRTRANGFCAVEPVPPEELLVNADHNSPIVSNARFACHSTEKTRSELVEMGFDKDLVWDLPSYDEDPDEEERNSISDEDEMEESVDKAMAKIRLYEIYILMDQDEDGIAERRRILYVKDSEILENEEVDSVPFAVVTPFIQTHRFIGQSLYDKVHDLQEQKTYIWRQILENLGYQNNQRFEVDVNKVNLKDMMTNRPGGIIRSKQIGSVVPIVTPPLGVAGYQMLEYLDKIREERTGVGPDVMGQNQNLSNDTAHGIERLLTAKEELVALIARVFGETGIKQMFLLIRENLMKHQDQMKQVKLSGRWLQINPAEWRDRTSMTLKVGLGTGDRLKQSGTLAAVLQQQQMLMQSPFGQILLQPRNIFKAHKDFAEAGGIADGEVYYTDPGDQQLQPPIDPQMVEQMQQQLQMMQQQLQQAQIMIINKREENQIAAQRVQAEQQRDTVELQLKSREQQLQADREAAKMQSDNVINLKKLDQDKAKTAIDGALQGRKLDLEEEKFKVESEVPIENNENITNINSQVLQLAEVMNAITTQMNTQAEESRKRQEFLTRYIEQGTNGRLKSLMKAINGA